MAGDVVNRWPETMTWTINTTDTYHTDRLESLGWELTVCNALWPENTALRSILSRDASFGHLLSDFLRKWIPMNDLRRVLEIGGGYGYLMNDLLDDNSSMTAAMIDISPFLLGRQRMTLEGRPVVFREEDFLTTPADMLSQWDLAIMNENLGDFPTIVGFDHDFPRTGPSGDDAAQTLQRFVETYDLLLPPAPCNVNIGALMAVEKLCRARVPFLYFGEHSCEASVSEPALRGLVEVRSSGNPERISLAGHDEYTIKFSHLEQVGRYLGYEGHRGPFADFITVDVTPELRAVLASGGTLSDRGEMICQFVGDLFQYEYLVLIRR